MFRQLIPCKSWKLKRALEIFPIYTSGGGKRTNPISERAIDRRPVVPAQKINIYTAAERLK